MSAKGVPSQKTVSHRWEEKKEPESPPNVSGLGDPRNESFYSSPSSEQRSNRLLRVVEYNQCNGSVENNIVKYSE